MISVIPCEERSGRQISAPSTGTVRITATSSGLSASFLLRISSGTPILPMSCTLAAKYVAASVSGSSPAAVASRLAIAAAPPECAVTTSQPRSSRYAAISAQFSTTSSTTSTRCLALMSITRSGHLVVRGCRRDRESEGRPLPVHALDPDPALVQLDDLLGDRQAQPGAHDLALAVAFVPFITAEDPADEFGRDAQSVVLHADLHCAVFGPAGDQDLAALWRVLDRVRQEVGHDLRQPVGVAFDPRQPGVEASDDLVPGGRHPRPFNGLGENAIQVHRFHVHSHATGLDTVEVEHLRDHPIETQGIRVDVTGKFLHLVR